MISVLLLSRCKVLLLLLKHDRSTSFAKANFRIGTEHLISFGRQVFTDVVLVFQAYGTF